MGISALGLASVPVGFLTGRGHSKSLFPPLHQRLRTEEGASEECQLKNSRCKAADAYQSSFNPNWILRGRLSCPAIVPKAALPYCTVGPPKMG